ncbi:DUF2958 domain-containing protein [Amorphus sp. 3PC139-8]|uniref:DUF2958 domain-containing protein n=1 Tax=Amorphus sp. 3PC139-8 TaxID=2735676 RepID=UPI00345CDA4E
MRFFTATERDRLIANYVASGEALAKDSAIDHWPVVKLFTPYASATWLLTEFDPEENVAFGLCDLGLGEPELGYVSLTELAEGSESSQTFVERDRYWEADGPLSAYAGRARELRQIPDSSLTTGDCSPDPSP